MTALVVTFAVLAVVAGGVMLAAQVPINAALARSADPLIAGLISFGVGFAVLAALALARGGPGRWAGLAGAPWWAWTGGLLGAFYVVAVIWAVPKLGVVTAVAAVVFGQLAAAMVLDATGAFGLPVQSISWMRAAAAALVLGGVVLSRAG